MDEILAKIEETLDYLSDDVSKDIFYDSQTFEPDYPDDGFTKSINRVRTTPKELVELFNALKTEMEKANNARQT